MLLKILEPLACIVVPALWILAILDGTVAADPAPQEIPFNGTRVLGPDGPWQIITLIVGNPLQSVDFYASIDADVSWFVAKDSCNVQTLNCLLPELGYYDRYSILNL